MSYIINGENDENFHKAIDVLYTKLNLSSSELSKPENPAKAAIYSFFME